jgi:hypothetical protein
VHGFSWDDTWGLQLDSGTLSGVDGTHSVDRVTEGVDDSAEQALADGNINDGSGSLDDISFLDFSVSKLGVSCVCGSRLTYLSLPKMTIPTLSVSKLRAIPLTPDLNSTISPAWTLVRPKTLAIPSPMEITDPNSFKSFCAQVKR